MLGRKAAGMMSAGFDLATITYIAAMTVKPSGARAVLIDNFIKGLKDDGLWSKMGWLCLLASHDAQAARVNVVNPAKALSVVNAPTFTTDMGYAGNGSNAYLACGETAFASGQYSTNSSHIAFYANTAGSSQRVMLGGRSFGYGTVDINNSLSVTYSLNDAGASYTTPAVTGMYTASRTSNVLTTLYRNGASVSTSGAGAGANPADNFSVLAYGSGSGPSTARLPFFSFGAGLTSTEAANLNSRVTAFLTAIGAN